MPDEVSYNWDNCKDSGMTSKESIDDHSPLTYFDLVKRDVAERGFDVAGVLKLYQRFVKPSYDNYVYPTKRNADVVRSTLPCFQVPIAVLAFIR